MMYFATDADGSLLDSLTTDQTTASNITCPFCAKKLILLFPAEEAPYFIHQVATDCSPTFIEQLYLYFQMNFPASFSVKLPSYEHVVSSFSIPLPNYPDKKYTLPSKTISFESRKIDISSQQIKPIQYDDPLIQVFSILYNEHSVLFIFNIFGCEINRDFLPEELFFSSTVIELTLPHNITKSIFENRIDLQSIFDMLTVTYVRNEIVSKEIQKLHRERQEEVAQIALTQDAGITRLVDASIINIRKH